MARSKTNEREAHQVNPPPKGRAPKRIVVDRNAWRPGNDDNEQINVACTTRPETVWAKRFDVYVLDRRHKSTGGRKRK